MFVISSSFLIVNIDKALLRNTRSGDGNNLRLSLSNHLFNTTIRTCVQLDFMCVSVPDEIFDEHNSHEFILQKIGRNEEKFVLTTVKSSKHIAVYGIALDASMGLTCPNAFLYVLHRQHECTYVVDLNVASGTFLSVKCEMQHKTPKRIISVHEEKLNCDLTFSQIENIECVVIPRRCFHVCQIGEQS